MTGPQADVTGHVILSAKTAYSSRTGLAPEQCPLITRLRSSTPSSAHHPSILLPFFHLHTHNSNLNPALLFADADPKKFLIDAVCILTHPLTNLVAGRTSEDGGKCAVLLQPGLPLHSPLLLSGTEGSRGRRYRREAKHTKKETLNRTPFKAV